ncbi:MAG: response regulator [Fulvimarina manganoxydans]|uniref:sensor histidine kinase n=1 Tax=Fulvimarina manganoxydans TaxID=937218 RepID=UPI002355E61A|nr:HWE histidine kinase domain-containing protein [Fulvimarina manganoxydans]MCK5931523.1 response regulator [Fulvimarina manganoxydans]
MTRPVQPVRILHLEDSDLDADLITEHLRIGGVAHRTDRVWERADFVRLLSRGGYDLILADYKLPSFDGLSALDIARNLAPDLPFIFVSATLGEEVAIEALKNGATDYVIKSRLGRLATCVERAIRETHERRRRESAEAENFETKQRLSAALSVAQIGTFEWDAESDQLLLDSRSRAIFDLGNEERVMADTLRARLVDEDRENVRVAINEAMEGRERVEVEFRIELPNGTVRHIGTICDWYAGHDGRYPRGIGVFKDITDRKNQEEQQALVVRELHHRVKNSLTTAQSVINFTLKTSPSFDDFQRKISARIASLARSHSLLTQNEWGAVSLEDILRSELAPYDPDAMRGQLSGPPVYLPSDLSSTYAMAFHEMTTNAVKYGSLSVPQGVVKIDWQVERQEDCEILTLSWTERGGPPIKTPPTRRGFGSTLLDRLLAVQLNGRVDTNYGESGARIVIESRLAIRKPPVVPPRTAA